MKPIAKKTERMLDIEKEYDKPVEEVLRMLYVDLDLGTKGVADALGISYVTAFKWLQLANVVHRRIRFD